MYELKKVSLLRFDSFYLAHPAVLEKEAKTVQAQLEALGLEVLNPFAKEREEFKVSPNWKPMDWWTTPHPPDEAMHIVERDLEWIRKSDALFAFVPEPQSFGTMMEIFYAAKVLEKPVFIYTSNEYRHHPWLTYFGQVFTDMSFMLDVLSIRKTFEEQRFRIAIGGKMGTGKSSLADFLVKCFQFTRYSFAAKLKEVAKDLFDMDKKNREFLQYLGTDVLRKVKESVWTDYLMKQIEFENPFRTVVDDMRFVNEAEALRRHGFLIVKLYTQDEFRGKRNVVGLDKNTHPSETEIDEIVPDVTLDTGCSLELCYKKVIECLSM